MDTPTALLAGYAIIIIPILGWLLSVERRLGRIEAGLRAVEGQLKLFANKLL